MCRKPFPVLFICVVIFLDFSPVLSLPSFRTGVFSSDQSLWLCVYLSSSGRRNPSYSSFPNRNKASSRPNNKRRISDRNDTPKVESPPPTKPGGPRPSYFSCRHTYEDTLTEEIKRESKKPLKVSSPFPGLVCVQEGSKMLPRGYDPAYALQALEDCVIVHGASIKQLAKAVHTALLVEDTQLAELFRQAPRGSLSVHALVPGMFKGQTKPVQVRRASIVAEDLVGRLEKGFRAARKGRDDEQVARSADESWLLQLLMLEPDVVVASLVKCNVLQNGQTWPNRFQPAGMLQVDIEQDMPSSAYRKLLEAFHCMRDRPQVGDTVPPVVDLGACPGGWTAALRLMDCSVVAVDRSKLSPSLMKDDMVTFVKGDAFKFEPSSADHISGTDQWMVSDIVAYPERMVELVDTWCSKGLANNMVVTIKFQGEDIAWNALDEVRGVASSHAYHLRIKHFFNNKNEVTVMLSKAGPNRGESYGDGVIGGAMYTSVR